MKTIYLILIGLIILAFPGCEGGCNFGGGSSKGGGGMDSAYYDSAKAEKEVFKVPDVPDSESHVQTESFAKGPKWKYPNPQPQPTPTTTTSGQGIPYVYVYYEGGQMSHSSWGSQTLLNSGLTDDQKLQALAVAQTYFPNLKIIISNVEPGYLTSGVRIKTWVTQSAWYMGDQYGGVTFTGCIWWFNDCPNFVYSSKLAMHPRYIGQLIAHELGHALGLGHRYNSTGGLLSCDVMGNPLDCNPASWNPADWAYLVNKLGTL